MSWTAAAAVCRGRLREGPAAAEDSGRGAKSGRGGEFSGSGGLDSSVVRQSLLLMLMDVQQGARILFRRTRVSLLAVAALLDDVSQLLQLCVRETYTPSA